MTCIVALKEDRGVVVGSDAITVQGQYIHYDPRQKIFAHNDLIIGSAGDAKIGATLMACLSMDLHYKGSCMPPFDFVVKEFMPNMKQVLRDNGMLEKEHGIETVDGSVLLAFNNSIFIIFHDGCVIESGNGFATIGSGQDVASGAYEMWSRMVGHSSDLAPLNLFKWSDFGVNASQETVENILTITEKYIMSVRRPFYILKTWEQEVKEPKFDFGANVKTVTPATESEEEA